MTNATLKTVMTTKLNTVPNKKGEAIRGRTHGERFAAVANALWPVSQELTDRRDVEAYSLALRLKRTTTENIYPQFRPVAKAVMSLNWNVATVRDALNVIRSAMPKADAPAPKPQQPTSKPEVKPAAPQQSELDKILATITPDTDMRRFNHHPMRLEILAHRNMLREALAPDAEPVVTATVEPVVTAPMPASDAADIRSRKAAMLEEILRQNQVALEMLRSL